MVVDAEHVLPQPDIVMRDLGVGPAHILTIIIHREPHPVPTSSEDHVNIVRAGEAFNTNRASTDPVAPPSTSRNGEGPPRYPARSRKSRACRRIRSPSPACWSGRGPLPAKSPKGGGNERKSAV